MIYKTSAYQLKVFLNHSREIYRYN